jgi:hypothetical protein
MELPNAFLFSLSMVGHATWVGLELVLLGSWPLLPRVRQLSLSMANT